MPRDYWLRHGHARRSTGFGDATYRCWRNMKARCRNPRDPAYERYGAKGVYVCERWNSFDNFLSDMGEKPEGMTIERIDGTKGYEPGNCKWATMREQNRNKRSNHVLTAHGKTMILSDWADLVKIGRFTIAGRLKHGWSVERALFTPVMITARWHKDLAAEIAREGLTASDPTLPKPTPPLRTP